MSTAPEEEEAPETELPPADISPLLPEKYRTVFRTKRCGGRPHEEPPEYFKVTLTIDEINFTKPPEATDYEPPVDPEEPDPDLREDPVEPEEEDLQQPFDPMPKGNTGLYQIFHDDCIALYEDVEEDPKNLDKLEKLSNQMAHDFFIFRTMSFDYVYLGVCEIQPTAMHDCIEFIYDADKYYNQEVKDIELEEHPLRPNVYTRVKSEPWSGYPEWFQHWDYKSLEFDPEADDNANDCISGLDRTPGIYMLVPGDPHGGGPGGGSIGPGIMGSVIALEDGRLVRSLGDPLAFSCGCAVPCGQVCVTMTSIAGTDLNGIVVTSKFTPVKEINVTNVGSNYTKPPLVVVATVEGTTANGSGCVAVAVLDDEGRVDHITVVEGGGYINPPKITFNNTGTGGTGAAAVAVLGPEENSGSCVIKGVITNISASPGSGYTSIPTITLTGGDGTGGKFQVNMRATALMIEDGGSGYMAGQTIPVAGGKFGAACYIRISTVGAGGLITAAVINQQGSYQELPPNPVSLTLLGTLGVDAKFNLSWAVAGVTVLDGGSGWTKPPTVTYSPPGGSGTTATGTATIAFKCCLGVFKNAMYKLTSDACSPPLTKATVICPNTTNIGMTTGGQINIKVTACQLCTNNTFTGPRIPAMRITGWGMNTLQNFPFGIVGSEGECHIGYGIPRPGKYQIEVLDQGCYEPQTKEITAGDCLGTTVDGEITLVSKKNDRKWDIRGCNGWGLPDATVTLYGPAGSFSGVTNDNGIATLVGMPNDCYFDGTVSHARFKTKPVIRWYTGCGADDPNYPGWQFVLNEPIDGYLCTQCTTFPVPKTLHGTCSEGGGTMRWAQSGNWAGWTCCFTLNKTVSCPWINCGCKIEDGQLGGPPAHTVEFQGTAAIQLVFIGSSQGGWCGIGYGVPICGTQIPPDFKTLPLNACCTTDQGYERAETQGSADCGGEPPFVCKSFTGCTGAGTCITANQPVKILRPPFSMTCEIDPGWCNQPGSLGFPCGTITVSE